MDKFDFQFGSEVYGYDKRCGHLAKVVVNPPTQQITDLIIENGLLFKRDTIIPVSKVESTTIRAAYLMIHGDEHHDFPEYRETVVEKGVPTWEQTSPTQPLPANEVPLHRLPDIPGMVMTQEKVRIGVADGSLVFSDSTPVYGSEGDIGQLSHLIVDTEEFRISQLIVTQGRLLPEQFVIPIHLVEVLSESGIYINATNAEVSEFPRFVIDNQML